jgi:hypothetical protein
MSGQVLTIALRVELPKLDQVSGSVVVTSTTDIADFCKFFNDLKKDNKIDGKNQCTSNNKKANEGKDGGDATEGSSESSDNDDDDSAAGMVSINMAVLALAGVAAVAQLF